ncbi:MULTISPECIES: ABC transporter ATP-binding protein [unclassified Paenibacillus]|uniref:ABC transporter ATP-binding protein n=1 Tax=unclassified Paenibacillus TaxID=185978 RepID=UPI0009571ACA|nr:MULTISPECIES: ABC transporter ATP-binding protein [unclassified Paenibacillus]ASS65487.1 ABC transporter ATP-binding protein [Paenibacillus sp. RUD330]SIQ34489.1 ATP-binding cassette, subfamily B [Paenibacillus sp. RU4X]SIQ56283.1 ATP-binding cassette, subfamily B [Paenibacillus sp. RU4T]
MIKLLSAKLAPYRWAAVAAPLFMLLEVAMDLLQPTFMAAIVDQGIMKSDPSQVLRTAPYMLGAALVGLAGGVLCTVYSTLASQNAGHDLRASLYGKVQRLGLDTVDRFGTGSLMTRLTGDIAQLQQVILVALRMLARSVFIVAGSIVMCIVISPRLSLVLIVMIPLLALLLAFTTRRSVPLFGSVQRAMDRVNAILQENLSGIRVVKAFVRAAHERERFGAANNRFLDASLRAARLAALNGPLLAIVLNFSTVAALWYGGALTRSGGLQPGELAAFLTYISQLLFATMNLGNHLMTIGRAQASARRIREVLEAETNKSASAQETVIPARTGREESCLELRGAGYRYPDRDGRPQPAALAGIDLSVREGERIGIAGINGAGKSTLAGLMAGLLEPTEGEVLLDGLPLKQWERGELRKRVGIVLQQAHLFSGSIRDNIAYGCPGAADDAIEAAAVDAQAKAFIDAIPERYEAMLGQRGVNLSGGQKQRVAIARTLLLQPDILILDDSSSALDASTDARLREKLERRDDTTLIVISQRISALAGMDRIAVLENGKLTAVGSHEELLASSVLYRQLADSQQGA